MSLRTRLTIVGSSVTAAIVLLAPIASAMTHN